MIEYRIDFKLPQNSSIRIPQQVINALRKRGRVTELLSETTYLWYTEIEDHDQLILELSATRGVIFSRIGPVYAYKSQRTLEK